MYNDIIPLPKKEDRVPLKIMSFDIEASSSHGDFPLPIKNYKKLAIDIIDKIKLDNIDDISNQFLKSCIKTAFGYGNEKNINKVYLNSIKNFEYKKLPEYTAVIICANHDKFDYPKILKYSKIIFDTRGVFSNKKNVVNC